MANWQASTFHTNRKQAVTEDQHAHHKRVLKALLSDASLGNKNCCDCNGRQPTWASVNLGCFVCLTCSGIHRSLGVHVSQVRSTTLDTWTPEQVAFVEGVGGNDRCNAFWEAGLDKHFVRPDGSNVHDLKRFIVDKYVHRRYVQQDEVRRMGTDVFDRWYAEEMRRQGGGGGQRSGNRVIPSVEKVGTPSQGTAKPVEDELLLLDVKEDAEMGSSQGKNDEDVWGDIEWISGDVSTEMNEPLSGAVPAPTPAIVAGAKKSVEDILALFDK